MKAILGLHVSHDASACLLVDNKICFAIQEERLTRNKFHDGFPRESVKWILDQDIVPVDQLEIAIAGVKQNIESPIWVYLSDAIDSQPVARMIGRLAARFEAAWPTGRFKKLYFSSDVYHRFLTSELTGVGLAGRPIRFYDHHECHAATAFLPSPYEQALIITQDGRGDGLSGTYSLGRGSDWVRQHDQFADASLGQIYAGVTGFLGFKPLRHEGKVTGLAAFGKDSKLRKDLEALFVVSKDGKVERISSDVLARSAGEVKLSKRDRKLINTAPEEYRDHVRFGVIFRHWLATHAEGMSREDVAFAVQTVTENLVAESVGSYARASGAELPVPVCLAGGLFANVKLNQRIRDELPEIADVFVQPAMGDCGLSLGAALLAAQQDGTLERKTLRHVYFGSDFSDDLIEEVLAAWPSKPEYRRSDDIESEIGQMLADKKVVGRFDGAMEFGPRALGNRSILIHPGDAQVNRIMNQRLRRTEFMPFAPSVLDRRAADYFVDYQDSQLTTDWMTITYDVFDDKQQEIQAVVHVDGTARPQVVRADTNPSFYRILEEFERLTGIGCVINTSFNMHEEPIVESPQDALRAFYDGSVDVLAIADYIVTRRTV